MGCAVAPQNAAHQEDDLGRHQFRDAAGITERGVEHGNPAILRGLEIHLIRPDAETAHAHQPVRGFEHFFRELRRRPDADEVRVAHCVQQLRLSQRLFVVFDVGVTVAPE